MRTLLTNQTTMVHIEHLRKADESYEIRHDEKGNAIHIYVTDGEAIVFRTLNDFIKHVYFGDPDVECHYLLENDLNILYDCPEYKFDSLGPVFRRLTSRKDRMAKPHHETLEFFDGGVLHRIVFIVAEPDHWFSVNGYDVHYCEDYNDIVVYREGSYDQIYSRKIKP